MTGNAASSANPLPAEAVPGDAALVDDDTELVDEDTEDDVDDGGVEGGSSVLVGIAGVVLSRMVTSVGLLETAESGIDVLAGGSTGTVLTRLVPSGAAGAAAPQAGMRQIAASRTIRLDHTGRT